MPIVDQSRSRVKWVKQREKREDPTRATVVPGATSKLSLGI